MVLRCNSINLIIGNSNHLPKPWHDASVSKGVNLLSWLHGGHTRSNMLRFGVYNPNLNSTSLVCQPCDISGLKEMNTLVLLSVHPKKLLPPTFILPSQTNRLFPSGFCRMKDALLFCQFLWTLPFSPGTASKTVISRTLRKRTGGLLKTVNYNFMSMTEWADTVYNTGTDATRAKRHLNRNIHLHTCIYWAFTHD